MQMASLRNLDGSVAGGRLPQSQSLNGLATLYKFEDDPHGRHLQWVKTKPEVLQAESFIDAIKDALSDFKGASRIVPSPVRTDETLLNVYIDTDLHLGLLSWGPETGGDYDISIARDMLLSGTSDLLDASCNTHKCVLLSMGDFFHRDNIDGVTARSGHVLDVDSRYNKQIRCGASVKVEQVDQALQKHDEVIIVVMPGNHDEHSAQWLAIALEYYYSNNPRVTVVNMTNPYWVHEFGATMLLSHHGHLAKNKRMAGIAAALYPEIWGRTKYRYGLTGHIHHKTGLEDGGMYVESFQTMAQRDAYASDLGLWAMRSMTAITYSSETGEKTRHTTTPKMVAA